MFSRISSKVLKKNKLSKNEAKNISVSIPVKLEKDQNDSGS